MSMTAPKPKANTGNPEPRIDGRLKVTGAARYPSDLAVNNPAYAYLVVSALARGRISRLDLAAAHVVPGVLDILTYKNASEIKGSEFFRNGGIAATTVVPLSSPKIWHSGQIVAMVVAETYEAAREAGYKVEIDYDQEEPTATFGSAGADTVALAEGAKSHQDPAGWGGHDPITPPPSTNRGLVP